MVVFAGFLKIIVSRVGFSHDFSASGVGVSLFLSAWGSGEFALSKIFPGGFARGMVRLGTDRYIIR